MNLVLLEPGELENGCAILRGRRARHIALVHRAEAGRTLRVGVLGGRIGSALVVHCDPERVELDVTLTKDAPPRPALTLLLALPRPKVLRRVLAAAAAFGVPRIVLFGAARVEKSYWQSPLASEEGMREALVAGLEQGGDTLLPGIEKRRLFRPFVEDELPSLAKGTLALFAHPQATESCPRAVREAVTLAIGPEGGFVDFELALLTAAGLRGVTMGERPLRVEHAFAALVGRLF